MSRNLDVISRLEEELETQPLDVPKWERLLAAVKTKDKEELVSRVFERYLDLFKLDGKQWCAYINYELARGEFLKVEQLFQRCLPEVALVDVLRLYVLYVRRVNDVITGGDKARRVVVLAFEFAVKLVGIDTHLGELWQEYIEFLQLWTPTALWEQQQKVDNIRKVYRRMLAIPTTNIEQLWVQYLKWESMVNQPTASKFVSDRLAEYMAARLWKTEWLNLTGDALERSLVPYLLHSDKKDWIKAQLDLWRRWVEFERKNTLELKDSVQLNARIEYCLRQATQALVFVPPVWFHYAKWFASNNDDQQAKAILVQATRLNPKLMLLNFQLAEAHEKDGNFDAAKQVYERLIKAFNDDYNTVNEKVLDIEKKLAPTEQGEPPKPLSRDERDELTRRRQRREKLKREQMLVWCKYMTATKRLAGIKEARSVFKQGRKEFADIGPEFYVENALLEHYNDNSKIAIKVFDLGLKQFPNHGKFLLAYLHYLIQTNDVDNIRKLIQLADLTLSKEITQLTELLTAPEIAKDVADETMRQIKDRRTWLKRLLKTYIRYAHQYLLMDVADSFITKYEQLFPDEDSIDLFTDRYRDDGVNLIVEEELDTSDDEDEFVAKRRKPAKEAQATNNGSANNRGGRNRRRNDGPNLPPPPRGLTSAPREEEPEEDSFVKPSVVKLLKQLPSALYFGEGPYDASRLVQMVANLPNVNTSK